VDCGACWPWLYLLATKKKVCAMYMLLLRDCVFVIYVYPTWLVEIEVFIINCIVGLDRKVWCSSDWVTSDLVTRSKYWYCLWYFIHYPNPAICHSDCQVGP